MREIQSREVLDKVMSSVWARHALLLGVAFIATAMALTPIVNFDLWWHLDSGRWMLDSGTVLLKEVRSFSQPGDSWTNLAWPFQLLVAWVYAAGGLEALLVLKGFLWVALLFLLLRELHRHTGHWALTLIASLPFALYGLGYLHLRPHLLEAFWWLLLLGLLRGPMGLRKYFALWCLLMVWANTHGSAVVGIVASGVHLLWLGWQEPGRRVRWLVGAVLLLLPLFMTPSGLGVIGVLLGHGADQSIGTYINEWLPPAFFPKELYVLLLLLIAGLIWRFPENGPAVVFLLLFFTVMSLDSKRFLYELALIAGVVLAQLMGQCRQVFAVNERQLHVFGVAVVTVLLGIYGGRLIDNSVRWTGWAPAVSVYPEQTVNILTKVASAEHQPVNVFNTYQYGGYLAFASQGRARIFIDGRTPTIFSPERLLTYNAALRDVDYLNRLARQENITALLMERSKGDLSSALADQCGAWWLVGFDDVASLYLKPALAKAHQLRCLAFNPNGVGAVESLDEQGLREQLAAMDLLLARGWNSGALAFQRAVRLQKLGQLNDANDAFKDAVRLAPAQPSYRVRLAEALLQTEGAEEMVAEVVEPFVRKIRPLSAKDYEDRLASILLSIHQPDIVLKVLAPERPGRRAALDADCRVWSMRAIAHAALGAGESAAMAERFAQGLCHEPVQQSLLKAVRQAVQSSD